MFSEIEITYTGGRALLTTRKYKNIAGGSHKWEANVAQPAPVVVDPV